MLAAVREHTNASVGVVLRVKAAIASVRARRDAVATLKIPPIMVVYRVTKTHAQSRRQGSPAALRSTCWRRATWMSRHQLMPSAQLEHLTARRRGTCRNARRHSVPARQRGCCPPANGCRRRPAWQSANPEAGLNPRTTQQRTTAPALVQVVSLRKTSDAIRIYTCRRHIGVRQSAKRSSVICFRESRRYAFEFAQPGQARQ